MVKLDGYVGSAGEKGTAVLLCWVAGVRDVDDSQLEIRVRPDAGPHRNAIFAPLNDIQIKRAVTDALLYDPRVRSMEIEVLSRLGAVSLFGNVSTLTAKKSAEEDAVNTLGVRRVFNYLKVRQSAQPDDPTVSARAADALRRDALLADFELHASSRFGKVYLDGTVNTNFEKERAEAVIGNIPGALAAVNEIKVNSVWKMKPDGEIKEDVQRRLHWSPLLDAETISVSVADGVVTLSGAVDTYHERAAAEKHALQGGARRVVDELSVRSGRTTPIGLRQACSSIKRSTNCRPTNLVRRFTTF